jgi:hypothetical protein
LDDIDEFNLGEYSFSFYYKFSIGFPVRADLDGLRNNFRFLGGLSENGDCAQNSRLGDRTLCVFDRYLSGGAGLQFSTYDKRLKILNKWQEMDLDWEREFDNQWNFVYFGYSIPLARGFAYV